MKRLSSSLLKFNHEQQKKIFSLGDQSIIKGTSEYNDNQRVIGVMGAPSRKYNPIWKGVLDDGNRDNHMSLEKYFLFDVEQKKEHLIDDEKLDKIQTLARLDISKIELNEDSQGSKIDHEHLRKMILNDLEKIMNFFEKMKNTEIDNDVVPMYSPLQIDLPAWLVQSDGKPNVDLLSNVRKSKDEPCDGNRAEDVLKNAAKRRERFFVVPKVIGESIE